MKFPFGKIVFALILSVLSGGCQQSPSDSYHSLEVREYQKETRYIRQWMELIYFHIKHELIGPPVAARIYGYVGVGQYESLVHGMPDNRSLAGQLNGLDALPVPEEGETYDWPTVMVEVLYKVSDEMLSRFLSGRDTTLFGLHQQQLAERAALVPEKVFSRSVAYGTLLSDALNEWALNDGYEDNRITPYKTPSRAGHPELWEPTDINQEPLEPYWPELRPMALDSSNACPQKLKFSYSDEKGSDFYKAAMDVFETDKNLTEDQRNSALFWADCPGETATPPGHWTFIMNFIIAANKLDLATASEMYALTGIGINDAFIQCWHTKYQQNLVRPKTYIRENFPGESDWEPYVITPPFPEYASGHSVVSASASTILTRLLGEVAFTDSTHVRIGLPPRSYTSFQEAMEEAAKSRVYGGMHYWAAVNDGVEQGKCVASKVLEKIHLKKSQ